MASVQTLTAGKRRQPFSDNVETPCEFEICGDAGMQENQKRIVCECERLGHTHHECSQYGSLPKKTCDGVSSLQFHSSQNSFISGDMQYDFYAMQCNNNTSAVNLNTVSYPHAKDQQSSAGEQDESHMESSNEQMEVCQTAHQEPRPCLRCVSGESGHINHILS